MLECAIAQWVLLGPVVVGSEALFLLFSGFPILFLFLIELNIIVSIQDKSDTYHICGGVFVWMVDIFMRPNE